MRRRRGTVRIDPNEIRATAWTADITRQINALAITNGTSVSVVTGPQAPALNNPVVPVLQAEDGSFVGHAVFAYLIDMYFSSNSNPAHYVKKMVAPSGVPVYMVQNGDGVQPTQLPLR